MTEGTDLFRRGILDFQVGDGHAEIPFEPWEYVRASAEAGVQELVFTCKDAYGDAWYDSDLIARNAVIGKDLLQEAIDAGKTFGVAISGYFNILLDDKIGEAFPAYRMVDREGEPVIAYDYYRILCPNSPYTDLIRERVEDVVRRYAIDGVFMDITYFQPGTCFCEACREAFADQFGYALPLDPAKGSRELRDWYAFRRRSRFRLIDRLQRSIQRLKPIDVVWNGSGSYLLAENEIDDRSSCLTSEFHAPDFLDGLVRAKWMHGRGKPFAMSTPCELGSWGDWTVNTPVALQAVISSIISNGGGVYVNHVPYPSGEFAASINPSILNSIRLGFDRVKKLEPWLRGARSVPDVAVVFSAGTLRYLEWHRDESLAARYCDGLKGVVKMLIESGRHFDVLSEEVLQRRIQEYRTVVLADTRCLGVDTTKVLRSFIRDGGFLVATGATSLVDSEGRRQENFELADVFGVNLKSVSPFSVDYVFDLAQGLGEGIPDNPILVQRSGSPSLQVTCREGAEAMASLVEPLFESSIDRHVYHQHAHPARRSGYPAVVLNSFGKGKSLYFASRLFSSCRATGSPWLQLMVRNALTQLGPRPRILVKGAPSVHVTLVRQGERHLIHLVNINDAKFDLSVSFMTRMIPVHDVSVSVEVPAGRVLMVPDGRQLDFKRTNEGIEFVVPVVELHQVLVIEPRPGEEEGDESDHEME
jgi:hypothetical protein